MANNPPSIHGWLRSPIEAEAGAIRKPRSAHGWRGGRKPLVAVLAVLSAACWPDQTWQISTRHVACLTDTEGCGWPEG